MNAALKPLPGDAPVLVTPLNLGHRVGHDGRPECGSDATTNRVTVKQAMAWSSDACVGCWKGERPW